MSKTGYVYIMTNKNRTTLYIGVTNNLLRRVHEHKTHVNKHSFTDRYNLEYCIYYEVFDDFMSAIRREKELKKWNRQKKENLINQMNPEWKEMATEKELGKKAVPFSQMVNDLVQELQAKGEIPPTPDNGPVIPSDSEESKTSTQKKENDL